MLDFNCLLSASRRSTPAFFLAGWTAESHFWLARASSANLLQVLKLAFRLILDMLPLTWYDLDTDLDPCTIWQSLPKITGVFRNLETKVLLDHFLLNRSETDSRFRAVEVVDMSHGNLFFNVRTVGVLDNPFSNIGETVCRVDRRDACDHFEVIALLLPFFLGRILLFLLEDRQCSEKLLQTKSQRVRQSRFGEVLRHSLVGPPCMHARDRVLL